MKPTVSIICITYNQEKYIKKCLDGLLMQKTNFPIEILIHDDASTDNTVKIIQQYKKNNPDLLHTIYEKENQFAKKNYSFIEKMFKGSTGKYIALCEGDDYWTDPDKLQLQVDLMEKNPDCTVCFHPVRVIFEGNKRKPYVFPNKKEYSNFNLVELVKNNFIQTNSVMYRRQKYVKFTTDTIPGDWYINMYHAQLGRICYIDKIMATYRRNPNGLWWDSEENQLNFWEKNWESHMQFYEKILIIFGNNKKMSEIITGKIEYLIKVLIECDMKYNGKTIKSFVEKYQRYAPLALKNLEDEIQTLNIKYNDSISSNNKKEKEIAELRMRLARIENSRTWRLRNKIRDIIGRSAE